MKKLTKTIFLLSIIGGILLFSGIIIYKSNLTASKKEDLYNTVTVKKSDSLIFKGIVQPKTTSYLNFDQSLGKINTISVKNGQEINENDVVAIYQNTTVEDQAEEQTQSLEKLNLAVTNAQINLDNATQKQQELENRLTITKNEQTTIVNKKMDDEIKKTEKAESDNKIETIQQALDTQKEAVLQAQQALDAANVDLSSANNTIEQTKKKITTTVTAPFKGIVYTNDKGKVDATVPYATIVSPETVIKGSVTEYDYNKVKVGQHVTISQINEEKATDGIITEINALPEDMAVSAQNTSSTKNSTISTFSFLISPKEPIHYGYNVQISVPMNNLELAKKNTVKENNNEVFVFIYREGEVVKKKIEVKEDNEKYIVKTGLKENDLIIENPDTSLKDGQKVTVKQ
ncbi:HlyD family secretion protein [Enterococcus sp. AZ120]|uniref:efflux RND transporter periplasmic adaptor subunit n=1 Tax=Enterococcus TaxID=1350 RepID=UPI001C48FCBF|nr:efflux RND transporter periplasmic adaptor subunit [Enterococcus faecalis]ELY8292608.1 efflux RND transporter periplasmic adaptor subunit [Enterococcus faecalis]QXN80314.1 efflux RND transporter periplasmic adaptor subunit [Enterococcus faecalis]